MPVHKEGQLVRKGEIKDTGKRQLRVGFLRNQQAIESIKKLKIDGQKRLNLQREESPWRSQGDGGQAKRFPYRADSWAKRAAGWISLWGEMYQKGLSKPLGIKSAGETVLEESDLEPSEIKR